MLRRTTAALALFGVCCLPAFASADVFTYVDEAGAEQMVEARIAAEARQHFVLEQDDGRWIIVPTSAVKKRTPGDDPKPITPAQMADRLTERFTKDLFRFRIEGNTVIGFVMTAPLDATGEERLGPFFDKAVTFVQQVDRVFTRFCEEMELEIQPPKYPQVMLVFERDEDFDVYAKSVMRREDVRVESIAGFYSAISNWLAIRMDESDTFEVPLHEAIHQHTFNRGLLQRLAPVPAWFSEGIATGFENAGNVVRTDPTKINRRYATQSMNALGVSFADVITQDASFRGNVLTSDAYTRGWALHWLLVTDRPMQYVEFVRRLGRLKPLEDRSESERLAEFRQAFDLDPAQLDAVYQRKLAMESRRQKVRPQPQMAVGNIVEQDQAGMVEIGLVRRGDLGGRLAALGKLKNLNPVRALSFRVSLVPAGQGTPISWFVQELGPGRQINLDRQVVVNASDQFRLEIHSALPTGEAVDEWKSQPGIVLNTGKKSR